MGKQNEESNQQWDIALCDFPYALSKRSLSQSKKCIAVLLSPIFTVCIVNLREIC